MLEIAKAKVPTAEILISKAEKINLQDDSVQLITVAFGVRNFASVDEAFKEFYRISQKMLVLQ